MNKDKIEDIHIAKLWGIHKLGKSCIPSEVRGIEFNWPEKGGVRLAFEYRGQEYLNYVSKNEFLMWVGSEIYKMKYAHPKIIR